MSPNQAPISGRSRQDSGRAHAIPQAEKTGHLDGAPNSRVVEVTVADDGRVNGVTYIKGGKTYHQPASIVVLSSYIYENIRLLLLSKSKAYPNGSLE